MELIDTHCHLDVAAFDADRGQVLNRARQQGVQGMVIPAVDADHWAGLIQLCESEQALFPALGLHPVYLQIHKWEHISALEREIDQRQPVAVGEIGLDYFIRELDREKQQMLFEAQLEVARNAGLPVILHVRKAHDQALSILRRIRVRGGTAHAFNGSLQQARQYIEMGFKLGFGGMLTYQRSNRLRRLAEELPVDAIVLETDAPDMVVAAHRGERNSPEYLPHCLRALADARNEDADFLARQTTLNACSVFSLPNMPS